jgi:hypothetical protein
VLAYEPPDRVVFRWDIDSKSQIETDLERTSEVEVRSSPMHPSGAPARAGGSVDPIVGGRREVHHLTPRAVARRRAPFRAQPGFTTPARSRAAST